MRPLPAWSSLPSGAGAGAGVSPRARRVLFVTYTFPPSLDVGGVSCAQIARYLPLYGWEPIVLTVREPYMENVLPLPDPSFPARIVRTRVLPHPLRVYHSLKSWLGLTGDGTGAYRSPLQNVGAFRRWILSLLMVPDPYTGWILPAIAAGLRVTAGNNVQHILSSGPYWTNHLVGLALARLTGLPWTAQFRDPWAQAEPCTLESVLSRRVAVRLEKMVLRHANAVVSVTEQHASLLRHTHPDMPSRKFITIPNGFDGGEWEALDGNAARVTNNDAFVITYAGSLYQGRNPLPLFRALRELIDTSQIDAGRLRIELIGDCSQAKGASVKDMAGQFGLVNCLSMPGFLDRAETLGRIRRSNLLLVLAEGWTLQIPGKTYEYLRAGRPILALTGEGALADLMRRTGGAWVVNPDDDIGIMTAIREAYLVWKNGLDGPMADPAVVEGFDRRVLAGRFAQVFNSAP